MTQRKRKKNKHQIMISSETVDIDVVRCVIRSRDTNIEMIESIGYFVNFSTKIDNRLLILIISHRDVMH